MDKEKMMKVIPLPKIGEGVLVSKFVVEEIIETW